MRFNFIEEGQLRKVLREELANVGTTQASTNDSSEQEWITNPEFLKRYSVSKPTAQRWRDEGRLPFSKVGAKIFYKISDVETFFESSRVRRRNSVEEGR